MSESSYYMLHIDDLRRKKKLTVEQICNGICSDRQYRRLLSGEQNISDFKIEQFCNKLGISIKDFYYSASEKDKTEYAKIAHLYNSLNPLNPEQYKTILRTINISRISNVQNYRFFRFCVEKYSYLSNLTGNIQAFENLSKICNYPESSKFDAYDFVDIICYSLMAEIDAKNGKDSVINLLIRILSDKKVQYLSSESKYILTNVYGTVSILLSRLKRYNDSLRISQEGIKFSILHSTFDALTHLYYVESFSYLNLGLRKNSEISGIRALSNAISRKNKVDFENVYSLLKRDFGIDPIELFKIHRYVLFDYENNK